MDCKESVWPEAAGDWRSTSINMASLTDGERDVSPSSPHHHDNHLIANHHLAPVLSCTVNPDFLSLGSTYTNSATLENIRNGLYASHSSTLVLFRWALFPRPKFRGSPPDARKQISVCGGGGIAILSADDNIWHNRAKAADTFSDWWQGEAQTKAVHHLVSS